MKWGGGGGGGRGRLRGERRLGESILVFFLSRFMEKRILIECNSLTRTHVNRFDVLNNP